MNFRAYVAYVLVTRKGSNATILAVLGRPRLENPAARLLVIGRASLSPPLAPAFPVATPVRFPMLAVVGAPLEPMDEGAHCDREADLPADD
jgi:hypothetical protein